MYTIDSVRWQDVPGTDCKSAPAGAISFFFQNSFQEAYSFSNQLSQFQKLEKLPNDKKLIVKELIEAFLLKTDLPQKLAHQ